MNHRVIFLSMFASVTVLNGEMPHLKTGLMEALDNERIIKTGDWLSIQYLADRTPPSDLSCLGHR